MREFSYHVKKDNFKTPGAFVEVARMLDGFLFDELAITKIESDYMGRHAHVEYERYGQRVKDMAPVVIAADEFAEVRTAARTKDGAVDFDKFANSRLVARLFSEASRQWLERNRKLEQNFIEDIAFLEELQQTVQN